MLTLLSRLFISNPSDTHDPQVRRSYGMLCGAVGIILNLLLFTGKLIAGLISHSIAITADAMNNLSDAGSSIITLIGFKMAGKKPDPDHPFGHGRIEYIAGLIVSMLIILMGFELLKSSVEKIFHPEELTFSSIAVAILIISILVKCYMFFYNNAIGKRIDSAAMKATATDSLSDSVATTVVLVATLISHFANFSVDAYCGVLVGLFILYAGYNAAKDTISPLLGQAPDEEFVAHVEEVVMAHPEIIGVHDLIVHDYGPGRLIISLHAEVPSDGDILVLHDVIDRIEMELGTELNCIAVIHMDPVLVGDETTDRLKALAKETLAAISPELSLHDFRIVEGPTHTNLIFDILAPFNFVLTDEQLLAKVTAGIKEANEQYYVVAKIDKKMA